MEKEKWYIGKVVRFYFSKNGKPLYYGTSGNKVPLTSDYNGCKPMMELVDKIPKDLDYEAYIDIAKKDLKLLGVDPVQWLCPRCEYVGDLTTYGDTEYDGDVLGECPNCNTFGIIKLSIKHFVRKFVYCYSIDFFSYGLSDFC